MKVLQIANDYFGTKLYASLFHALENEGIDNMIFVPVKKTDRHGKEKAGEQYHTSSLTVSPCFSETDRFLFFSKQKKILKSMKSLIDFDNISTVHAHTLFSAGYAAMKIKEQYGKPYIAAVRNVDVNVFFKKMKFLHHTGIHIMKEASAVIFLSPAYKKSVLDQYVPMKYREEIRKKCYVIPNGISSFFLSQKSEVKHLENGRIRLIYAGEINRNKNLTETIEAVKILKKRGYDVRYTAVGDLTDRRCGHLTADKNMIHKPKCSHEELIKYYREADIFVMPSHTETFGLVYAEAMSQGLPVIYTKGQGFDGQFPQGEAGFGVSGYDASELADRIIEISQKYSVMSENAVNGSSKFDWRLIADKYAAMYKRYTAG